MSGAVSGDTPSRGVRRAATVPRVPNQYDEQLAGVYDLVNSARGKNYLDEATTVTGLIHERCPEATTLLDVACGTGGHLRFLRSLFTAEGLEQSAAMARIAREKLPGTTVHEADMRSFQLDRTFDAVTCLFSSVGHLPSVADLDRAVATMAGHLRPGGVLVVEPWLFPHAWVDGTVSHTIADGIGSRVVRMYHSTQHGRFARSDIHYLVGDRDGVRHFSHVQDMFLFTGEEYEAAYRRAGCTVAFHEGGLTGRGLYVGVRDDGKRNDG